MKSAQQTEQKNEETKLLELKNVKQQYKVGFGIGKTKTAHCLSDISFAIEEGKTLGLVGESGSGKTTTTRVVLGIEPPTAGEVRYRGKSLSTYGKKQWKSFREEVQAVFQNPLDSFDPRFSVGQILDEPLSVNRKFKRDERKKKVAELLEMVGLSPEFADRYPHEFSGGQLQRIAIARALALEPKLLVLDEPVSALDVSVRGQILNLLHDLQKDKKISYLYISHDIASVRYLCDSIAIIYFGQIVEYGSTEQIFENPLHPYTQELLRAGVVTKLTDEVEGTVHEVPSVTAPPPGCPFADRCRYCAESCRAKKPVEYTEDGKGHFTLCRGLDPAKWL